MKEWWYKIKNFFRNLYIYRKILTTDYQFDYGYLLDLEKFKLQLMLKSFKFELKKIYLLSKKKYIQVCKEGNICFSKKRLPCCFQYSSDCSFYPCPSRVYTY